MDDNDDWAAPPTKIASGLDRLTAYDIANDKPHFSLGDLLQDSDQSELKVEQRSSSDGVGEGGKSEEAALGEGTSPNKPSGAAGGMSSVENEASPEQSLSSPDQLNKQANDLIENLNRKREKEGTILSDFKIALDEQTQKTCRAVEELFFERYEAHGQEIQTKLQDLLAITDRIAQLELELKQFKSGLGLLFEEMAAKKDAQM